MDWKSANLVKIYGETKLFFWMHGYTKWIFSHIVDKMHQGEFTFCEMLADWMENLFLYSLCNLQDYFIFTKFVWYNKISNWENFKTNKFTLFYVIK